MERHPEEMTIVLQHQFWDLNVTGTTLDVGLSFGGIPEKLVIPFEAITSFWDPSVDFGLKFELASADTADNDSSEDGARDVQASEPTPENPVAGDPKDHTTDAPASVSPEPQSGAEIVSLSAFRKKP